MKKLLAIFMLCFAVFAAKAQVFLLQESFEASDIPSSWTIIDNDGDGNNWYVLYGQGDDPEGMAHTGIGHITSASWQSSAFTPDNYLITGGIEIPANANQPTLSWWAKGQDPDWAAEHYAVYISTTGQTIADFTAAAVYEGEPTGEYVQHTVDLSTYAGQTIYVAFRHYNITDMFRLNLDDIEIYTTPTVPTLTLSEEDIDFGTIVVNETAEEEVLVSTLLVTDAVEVSTSAPFAVSLDGTTFAATATIPATTDMANTTTVYVRFTPTAAEEYTGTVIFTAGELVDTVLVAGNGFECTTVTEFPYQTDFSDETMNLCWTIEDANNDNKTFTLVPSSSYAQYSWNSSSAADDWLISPVMALTGNEFVRFDYKTGSSYDEKFEVAIIQGSTRTIIVPEMTVRTSSYLTLDPVVLSAYTGDYQIGIHCTSDADMFYLYVTNFVVSSLDDLDSSLTVNPEAIDFGNSLYTEGMTATETVTVSAIKIHNVTASVEAPYSVSLDGTTFAASVAIPDEDPVANTATLYVQFAPTAAGSFPGVVTLTNGTTTATINLTASVADCSTAETLPFVEDFEDELSGCWQNIDNDGDGYTWMQMTGYEDYAHSGSGLYTSASWVSGTVLTPDNWLITPALAIPEEGAHLDFWVGPQDPSYPAEHYQVKVSTTGTNVSDFTTTLIDETLTDSTWVERVANLDFAGQNVYVAFVHNQSSDVFRINIDDINISAGIVDGIEEETAENAVSVYPNPASTMLNVHAENFDNVQVINFLGQVVYSASVTENDFQINVSNLSNGVYFIRLNGENTVTKKFVKK